jgi:hypothetical protein
MASGLRILNGVSEFRILEVVSLELTKSLIDGTLTRPLNIKYRLYFQIVESARSGYQIDPEGRTILEESRHVTDLQKGVASSSPAKKKRSPRL